MRVITVIFNKYNLILLVVSSGRRTNNENYYSHGLILAVMSTVPSYLLQGFW